MFFKEIFDELKIDAKLCPFIVTNLGFLGTIVEGKFFVDYYSTVKIILKTKKQSLYIYGQNLNIKNMQKDEIIIVGEIFSVSSREVNIE
ncbi:MAG: YabP/YqfC family sporulation protein [Clostridia bacterium]|nr:YabP/YqfC family sporulation protein [Clostridia bacterium]